MKNITWVACWFSMVLHGSPWFSLYADCVASLNFVTTKPGSPIPSIAPSANDRLPFWSPPIRVIRVQNGRRQWCQFYTCFFTRLWVLSRFLMTSHAWNDTVKKIWTPSWWVRIQRQVQLSKGYAYKNESMYIAAWSHTCKWTKTLVCKPCVSTGKRILNLQENCSTYADSKYATLSWSSFARVNRCLVHRVRVCVW